MKRRFLSTLMALCLALSLLPTAAFAAGGHVAQVGDTTYATLQEAIEAAGKKYADSPAAVEITLLADVTTEDEMVFSTSGEYILNLDTHTFTSTDLEDVIEVRTGDIDLTIRNGSLIGQGEKSYGIYVYRDSANNHSYDNVTITLDGVKLTTKDQGLGVQGLNSNQNLIVRSSSVSAATAIYFPPMTGSLLIENSTITGINNGIVIKGGSLTVRGNTTISASADPVKQETAYTGSGTFPVSGSPIYVEGGYDAKGSSAPRPIEVTIENGNFNSGKGDSLLIGFTEAGGSQDIYVQGGDFNQGITNDGESDLIIANATVGGTVTNTGSGTTSISSSTVESVGGGVRYYNSTIGGTAGQSSGDAVASVDGKIYTALSAAISDADENDTITLLAETIVESVTIPDTKKITLDLNGKKLVNSAEPQKEDTTAEESRKHTITNRGTLKVIDTAGGIVDNVSHGRGALVNYGTAVLEGGKFTRSAEAGSSPSDNGDNSWYVIDNHGEMTINGAEVTSEGEYSSLIRNIKKEQNEKGVLNVKNGYLSNGFITLKNDTAGKLNVTGGTIESGNQAVQNWSQAELSGGTFEGNVITWSKEGATSKTTISDDAKITGKVIAVNYDGGKTPAAVEITGGTVIGEISKGTYDSTGIVPADPAATSSKITVSKGNFSKEVDKNYLNNTIKAQLFSTSNPDAPYSYYESVKAAQEAAGPNDVITDLKPEGGGDPVTIYTITLNNGNTVYNTYFIKAGEPFTLPSAPSGASNQRFDGWSFHGNLYQPGARFDTINTSMTFDAMWSTVSSGSSSTTYSPALDVSDGGTIKVSPRTPEAGDEVTITPDPDSGYEVDQVTVTDRDGDEIRVTANRDGTYTFTQPRGRVTIEVTFVRAGESVFFDDVPASFWAYDEIAWAYDNGYVNGTSAATFSPNSSITRQQVWMILARLSGADPASMAAAREWAMVNDISDGTNPGNAVTRQQLVALLYRYAQMMGYDNGAREALTSFPDAGTVSGYAQEPMQWSVANGIVAGTSAGTLNPAGTATRAQFAVILYRFWDQVG